MNINSLICTLLLLFGLLAPSSYAQKPFLKKLERMGKRKLEQRAERKASQTMDKGLDKVEEAIDKNAGKQGDKKSKNTGSSSDTSMAKESAESAMGGQEISNPQDLPQSDMSGTNPRRPILGGNKELKAPEPFADERFGSETIRDKGQFGKGPFGIESGLWVHTTRTNHQMMESIQQDTIRFARFGHLQAHNQFSSQKMNMMGMNRNQEDYKLIWHVGDSIYSMERGSRRGVVMENLAKELYQGMTEAEMQQFSREMEQGTNTIKKRLGTDRVAGKLCEVYEFTTHDAEGKVIMITRIWWYKGLTLKMRARGMGTEIEQDTRVLKEGITFPYRLFKPDPSVRFRSFSLNNY